jgi:hypothetical protein
MAHPKPTPKKTPDPNQAAYDAYGGKAAYDAAKAKRDKLVKQADATAAADYQYLKGLQATYKELEFNYKTAKASGDTAGATYYSQQMTKVELQISVYSAKAYEQEVKALDARKAFQDVIKKAAAATKGSSGSNNSSGSGDSTNSTSKLKALPYNYNAPLLNDGNFLHLKSTQLPKMIANGQYPVGDALYFWTSAAGGKGTIQMDRQTATSKVKAEAKLQAAKYKLPFDDTMYGFKFHYNPTTVNMSWAGMAGANPIYEMLDKDPSVPIATNLFTGTISFDIILNRIQDIALLGDSANPKLSKEPYGKGITVPSTELKSIADKGTMYDIDYLFKTLHGWAGFSNNSSTLMGKTNDPGWLPVRPVELHLGNKLRYRVRVSGLEVVHKIFSDKMVPLLSVVSITCMRYWDGPVVDPKKDKKK